MSQILESLDFDQQVIQILHQDSEEKAKAKNPFYLYILRKLLTSPAKARNPKTFVLLDELQHIEWPIPIILRVLDTDMSLIANAHQSWSREDLLQSPYVYFMISLLRRGVSSVMGFLDTQLVLADTEMKVMLNFLPLFGSGRAYWHAYKISDIPGRIDTFVWLMTATLKRTENKIDSFEAIAAILRDISTEKQVSINTEKVLLYFRQMMENFGYDKKVLDDAQKKIKNNIYGHMMEFRGYILPVYQRYHSGFISSSAGKQMLLEMKQSIPIDSVQSTGRTYHIPVIQIELSEPILDIFKTMYSI